MNIFLPYENDIAKWLNGFAKNTDCYRLCTKWAISDIREDSEQRANNMHEAVVAELSEMIKWGVNNG